MSAEKVIEMTETEHQRVFGESLDQRQANEVHSEKRVTLPKPIFVVFIHIISESVLPKYSSTSFISCLYSLSLIMIP
jgi:hypothetical protein